MNTEISLASVCSLQLTSKAGQLRLKRVSLGPDQPTAFLAAHSADFDVDPYIEMFFFPTDNLHLTLFTDKGEIIWTRDLGPGVIPGMHFTPFHTADFDNDGTDEIYLVTNINTSHPLSLDGRRLQRLDVLTGIENGMWDWPKYGGRSNLSHTFRNFIFSAAAGDKPVLITAQGTYEDMYLQGWTGKDLESLWQIMIPKGEGCRSAHGVHLVDIDNDGIDEFFWGERCLKSSDGSELWCAEKETYTGHSDVNVPVLDENGNWFMYTCRESGKGPFRVNLFDSSGERVWGDLEEGHIDMGWVARLGDEGKTAMAARIGRKTCGPEGRFHEGTEFFLYNAFTGERVEHTFDPYKTLPVDLNGDGRHELVQGQPSGKGEVFDRFGKHAGNIRGTVAMARKILDLPGEHLITYQEDGTVEFLADVNAEDSDEALARYSHPHYEKASSGTGLGGL